VTGLPNRRQFDAHLARLCQTAAPALLVLDLDGFKDVNDTLGHQAGDALLCHVAERLRSVVREQDMVARLGGDEFAVVVEGAPWREAEATAQRIVEVMSAPVLVDESAIVAGVSVGIALYPDDGTEPRALMRRADLAMYAAKRGRTGVVRLAA
jgi:diguanylate cyclase (GGDEF)-like protein